MLTGKRFAEELLRILDIQKEESEDGKFSETFFKVNGTSKIILRRDSTETSSIVIAAHEVGHFINNRNNFMKYLAFKWSGLFLGGIVIFSLIMVLLNQFFFRIPLSILITSFSLSFLCSFLFSYIKLSDEFEANKEALKLLNTFADEIFLNTQDSRSWSSISSEAKDQLQKGTQKYKESNFIIFILGLLPTILYFFIKIFPL
ncbi:zinc metallopeptidase [Bacillus suaedaesalsae]|uniref:Zinc metallopeptidase n=1 Tax=Bacillus suaedaesalsae TaxID=2810349 RepID=A0ABS2DFQ6_9BACI|nr:zinc metallopeptidase [Bacillus suaedaesalsae]MBM6617298.1 zinc metallopeptidase [Bacillus suaedaesalsae]